MELISLNPKPVDHTAVSRGCTRGVDVVVDVRDTHQLAGEDDPVQGKEGQAGTAEGRVLLYYFSQAVSQSLVQRALGLRIQHSPPIAANIAWLQSLGTIDD